jgi:hypothetical protein
MAKRIKPETASDHSTYATDFFQTDVDKVRFYDDPMTDNIVTAILALGTEMWSNRRRTLVLERLLEQKGVTRDMIEGYMPTDEDVAGWQTERDRLVKAIMGPLMREGRLAPSTDWQKDDS